MANENDNIKPEGVENNEEPKHHHSLLENIVEKIQNLDSEFPLSGGETEEDLDRVEHAGKDKDGHSDENKEEHHKKTSFFDDLDTEFPLSGGEVPR